MSQPHGGVKFNNNKPLKWFGKPSGLALALLVLGFVLRSLGLQRAGLWHDEGFTYLIARLPLEQFFAYMKKYEILPPLWYLICKLPLFILPKAFWVIRLPSLLAGVASLYLIYVFLRTKVSERAGLLALAIGSFSPLALFYAQEGRNYALFGLFYLLSFMAMVNYRDHPSKSAWIAVVLTTLMTLYTHSLGVILWFTLNVIYFLFAPKRTLKNFQGWVLAQILIFLGFAPWFWVFLGHAQHIVGNASLEMAWQGNTWYSAPIQSIRNLVPGDRGMLTKIPLPALPVLSWVMSGLVLVIVVFARPWRKMGLLKFLLPALLLPLFTVSLYSDFLTPAYQMGRTEVMVAPFFWACAGVLLAQISNPYLRRGLLVLLIFGGSYGIFSYHFSSTFPRKMWDQTTAKSLFYQRNPGLIIIDKDTRISVGSHLLADGHSQQVMIYPMENLQQQKDLNPNLMIANLTKRVSREVVDENLLLIGKTIIQKKPQEIALVYPARKEGKRFKPHSYTDYLIYRLKQNPQYQLSDKVLTYPMDWQHGGYHRVYFFQRKAVIQKR